MASVWLVPDGLDGERVDAAAARMSGLSRSRVETLIAEGSLNDKMARQVIDGILAGEGTADEVVASRGLVVVSDDGALTVAVQEAISANPDVADKVRGGKVAAVGALVGAVMKATRGQADAGRVRELLLETLGVQE